MSEDARIIGFAEVKGGCRAATLRGTLEPQARRDDLALPKQRLGAAYESHLILNTAASNRIRILP